MDIDDRDRSDLQDNTGIFPGSNRQNGIFRKKSLKMAESPDML
ncbi:MAG: hypothetical protein AB4290_23105 [Spirulina sp.]